MGGIFISYRQSDSAGWANWLYGRLRQEFGDPNLFRDVNTTEPGLDYVEAVERTVAQCNVLIAVIGPKWLTVEDKDGKRRLDDPRDLVRLEIERALARNIRVIPLLTDDTPMPTEDSLPYNLKPLAFRNAVVVSNENSETDIARLIGVLKREVPDGPAKPAPAASLVNRLIGVAIGILFLVAAPIAGAILAALIGDKILKPAVEPALRLSLGCGSGFVLVIAIAAFLSRRSRTEAYFYWAGCALSGLGFLGFAMETSTRGVAEILIPGLLVIGVLGFMLLRRMLRPLAG